MKAGPGRRHDIVMIGGSAGSIEALTRIVRAFPPDLLASVFIVIHTTQNSSYLPQIFNRNGHLPALMAERNVPVLPRRIYVAQPGRHLILNSGHLRLVLGPRENRHRPSIDALFRSGAHEYRERVIAVVLSGYRDDGAIGLARVKQCGGIAIVQDPNDALVPEMPSSAMLTVDPDFILPAARIGETVVELVQKGRSKKKAARRPRS